MYSSTTLLCSSENFLQPVWRRQVPNSVASLTSFAGCYFLPTVPMVLVMTTCFDPEFCFLRLIWVIFPSCVLLRTDLTWLFLGVCVLSTHHRVQRGVEMQCTQHDEFCLKPAKIYQFLMSALHLTGQEIGKSQVSQESTSVTLAATHQNPPDMDS